MMDNNDFKSYKEKQEYYKNKLKQERYVWVSKENNNKKSIIKGRTYRKPKSGDINVK